MTSLRGHGERNFNAVSHKPTRAPIQFNSIQSVPVSFGLWDTALKFLSPGPRSDVTDHLEHTDKQMTLEEGEQSIMTSHHYLIGFKQLTWRTKELGTV